MRPGITYDRHIKLSGVGPSAWVKLGPERWFDDYAIVCANARGYDADYIVDLGLETADLKSLTTQSIVSSKAFRTLAMGNMADYRFIVYKPIRVPEGLDQKRFVVNPDSYKRFENKRVFREVFADKLPIPRYQILTFEELLAQSPAEAYGRFSEAFGEKIVLQDELGGGGRGTFIIWSADDMGRAMSVLASKRSGKTCVVSEFISGVERSIQVFVSSTQVLMGPLQQQLLRHPQLLDPDARGGLFFCGGKFIDDAPEATKTQVTWIVQNAAEELRAAGYKGMFGMDFIVDHQGRVYVLEINARTTGILPLLNEQQTDVPLYLLHILELAGEPYSVMPAATPKTRLDGPQSFVVLFNQKDYAACFDDIVQTGNYKITPKGVDMIDSEPRWNPKADFMLQLFASPDFPAAPNFKLCHLFLREAGFDDKGQLDDSVVEKLKLLKKHVVKA